MLTKPGLLFNAICSPIRRRDKSHTHGKLVDYCRNIYPFNCNYFRNLVLLGAIPLATVVEGAHPAREELGDGHPEACHAGLSRLRIGLGGLRERGK
jgi:hypothetical protein